MILRRNLKRAGLPFAKAKIGFIAKPRRYCGGAWGESAATYCGAERRFQGLLMPAGQRPVKREKVWARW